MNVKLNIEVIKDKNKSRKETEIITTYSHMVGGDGISYYFGTSKERYDKFNFLKRVSEEITDRNHRRKMITARLDKLYIIL